MHNVQKNYFELGRKNTIQFILYHLEVTTMEKVYSLKDFVLFSYNLKKNKNI